MKTHTRMLGKDSSWFNDPKYGEEYRNILKEKFQILYAGILSGGVAFVIGKITLGLRSDYLAIATLGISEIIIAVLKSEEWLSRGVKNVVGLKRPVPYEIDLQKADWFISIVQYMNQSYLFTITDSLQYEKVLNQMVIESSIIFVKISYALLFFIVLLIILYLANKAQISPWGRMMRATYGDDEGYGSAYVRTSYIRTYVRTYVRTYIHTHMCTYLHTYVRTYVRTYVGTYVHT